ncbi:MULTISPECIES: SDR family oxidoreductase [unclassified Mycobacterium]|uniref:SDR family NAD(P)-dependent oxidoreductase n=1 Tax=unclassified Mycobacterium TaxID=2642494 RepID=UPI000490D534|nr:MULTISPECIES: SDR family oxidoreductase [unclassified Mycobacterium]SEA62241.1 NAD(P)-dependent dehydrogenase, short-chain alcohol dehydrogenase family [Mycobacterium sp. 283mftsu]
MTDLSGLTAVVTGGNRGIGLALSEGIAKAGGNVAIWARNAEQNAVALDKLSDYGVKTTAIQCDITDERAVAEAMQRTVDELGPLGCFMANAGVSEAVPITEMTLDTWRQTMSINLDGTFLCTREAARRFIAQGTGGSVVVVSSTISRYGGASMAAYATSKSGLLGLGRTLAVELARYQVRCNILIPGWTRTDMNTQLYANERFRQTTMARTPARRWAEPEEFHEMAAFLADPKHTFHTGNEVIVDGGYTIF